jgi:hypothetical protein
VAFDRHGMTLVAASITIEDCRDTEEAEANTIKAGHELGIDMNLNQVCILSNCASCFQDSYVQYV